MIKQGKFNLLLGGQFGSEAKGMVASYIASKYNIDIVVTNAGANAGHTCYINNKKCVTTHIPITALYNKTCLIYFCSGAIINRYLLTKEIKKYKINTNRIHIHPRATIIDPLDSLKEKELGAKISSTHSGTGYALSKKIQRKILLAKTYFHNTSVMNLNEALKQNKTIFMEVPQGFDLSINSGLSYPYCTSREITVASSLSDAQVHPKFLGKVNVVIRTYPIRAGNYKDESSGPIYPDQKELSWRTLGIQKEYATKTKRARRIFSFSYLQYHKMLQALQPDNIILSFINYLNKTDFQNLIHTLPEVTHTSCGPNVGDLNKVEITKISSFTQDNINEAFNKIGI